MIIVDVVVPSVGRKYQFNLEELVSVGNLIEELVEIICQKEQCTLIGVPEKLYLCSGEQKKILKPDMTLSQQEIVNGDWLLLI